MNLYEVVPPKTAADRARRRAALVARSKTRAVRSPARMRALAPKPPEGARMAYQAGLGRILKRLWAIVLEGFQADIDAIEKRADDLRSVRLLAAPDKIRVKLYHEADVIAPPLIDATAQQVSKHNLNEGKRLVGIDPRIDPGIGASLDQFRVANVKLIRSIADDQLARVQKVLIENYGTRVEGLSAKLQDQFDVTKSRANLIARDQTSKLNGQLTRVRQQNAGVESYVWVGSRDERERETHLENEGKTFRWDTPPETGHPGEDFQCRCAAFPVIPGLDDAAEEG